MILWRLGCLDSFIVRAFRISLSTKMLDKSKSKQMVGIQAAEKRVWRPSRRTWKFLPVLSFQTWILSKWCFWKDICGFCRNNVPGKSTKFHSWIELSRKKGNNYIQSKSMYLKLHSKGILNICPARTREYWRKKEKSRIIYFMTSIILLGLWGKIMLIFNASFREFLQMSWHKINMQKSNTAIEVG